jgi:hypothetical protein
MKTNTPTWFWIIAALLFIAVISINITKPFGFFRETNAALVCINATVWNNHPELAASHIPVTSYSFFTHTQPQQQLYSTTTTFGFGWFAAPYYFFKVLHIPISDLGIRCFALLWFLITLSSIYLLTKSLIRYYGFSKQTLFITIALYVFNPALLWYHVQGYVHETAVLPFYFLAWWCFVQYVHQQKIKWVFFTGLFLIVGVQFDWLPCFQALVMSGYLLFTLQKQKQKFAFVLPAIAIAIGVAYIISTYASWAGWQPYLLHMQSKFLSRTLGNENGEGITHFKLLIFYSISLVALLPLFFIAVYKRKLSNPIIWMMVITALLHHIIFWGFSNEHDHAVVKMIFPIAFTAAFLLSNYKPKLSYSILALLVITNVGGYFVLHNTSIIKKNIANNNFCYQAGYAIKSISTDVNEIVFIDTQNKYYPQIEFYAGKYYVMAPSLHMARQILPSINPTARGCFVQLNNNGDAVNVVHF